MNLSASTSTHHRVAVLDNGNATAPHPHCQMRVRRPIRGQRTRTHATRHWIDTTRPRVRQLSPQERNGWPQLEQARPVKPPAASGSGGRVGSQGCRCQPEVSVCLLACLPACLGGSRCIGFMALREKSSFGGVDWGAQGELGGARAAQAAWGC
ncbi:uncharacterized protein LY79DRAFT_177097 [Colletotrichum navitas]|uniref:Uncharacterized protein n=1 Tax=Colletotrichum navitas TaxID=681940 RepID=A0AAD8Q2J0_9PEZI|nr:uncharacterized protein LY79DRAFT_177097 [Colletotrichum navitas]KAK1593684.1 hypothetical protein LY79DRAFT_177097 [Colletotrichum navitas]